MFNRSLTNMLKISTLVFLTLAIHQALCRSMSEKMCRAYSADACSSKPLPLIVGGLDAEFNEFPHMALIGFGQETVKYQCGGSLISDLYVLSAAHCSESNEDGPATFVKLGMSSRSQNGPEVVTRGIEDILVHPNYKQPLKYNDIALYRMDRKVEFKENLRPACINFKEQIHGTPVATGFGKLKFADAGLSDKLMKVELPVLDTKTCQPFYASMKSTVLNRGIDKTMICAGTVTGGRDTCLGDSGGPLQVYLPSPYCSYSIIGVTSFGKFCGFAKSPAIYTNVYKYVSWIEKHVW